MKSGPATAFQNFWAVYPRRQAKGAALQAYQRALKEATVEELYWGAMAYRIVVEANKTPQQYQKLGATWLNQMCWEDEHIVTSDFGTWSMDGTKARERHEAKQKKTGNVVSLK